MEVQLTKEMLSRLTRRSSSPKLLVALALPETAEVEVVEHEHLLLRRCAYFARARDLDPNTVHASKVVRVPFSQPFTPEALRAMMERVSKGEPL